MHLLMCDRRAPVHPASPPSGHAPGMHIGLIGGIGPAATIAYYDRLTRRVRDAGGRLELTIVQASSPELLDNVAADRREDQARAYAVLIDRLKAAGADCAAITSIAGH